MLAKRGFSRRLAVWLRARGRCDFMREVVARPDRPRRCTLPITALRVTPPRRPAIWLAERPSAHSFFKSSTRSSFQAMPWFSAVAIAAGRRIRAQSGPQGRSWKTRLTRQDEREREPEPAAKQRNWNGDGALTRTTWATMRRYVSGTTATHPMIASTRDLPWATGKRLLCG